MVTIISRSQWGARHDRGFGSAPLPARELYLHHSVTIAPDLIPPFTDDDAAIRTLERIGEERFGGGISYTFAITPVGRIYEGHGIDRLGAHTGGRNSIARAICLVGNYDVATPPPSMVNAVIDLVRYGADRGWWPRGLTGGHKDAPGALTSCPGRFAHRLIPSINSRIRSGGPVVIPPVVPPATRKRDNSVINEHIAPGKGGRRFIIPTGNKASSVTKRAWISVTVNGPKNGSLRYWYQSDTAGISDGVLNVGFRDGRSDRVWREIPNGTTQINLQWDFPEGGTIAFETESF